MGWGAVAAWFALGSVPLAAVETWGIDFEYPLFQGDFYVAGTVSFPPGTVRSAEQLRVQSSESGEEMATCIKGIQTWPDGSLRKVEIIFPANNTRPMEHVLVFGEEIKRSRVFTEPAVLPTIAFAVSGAPRAAETMDISVGAINIRVDRSPRIYYYWHLVPIILLIFLTGYRTRRAVRAGAAPLRREQKAVVMP